jgi:hypothetical protein
MCQAIVKPRTNNIDESVLRAAWNSNPHGAGIAYREGDTIRLSKGFFKLRSFLRAYRQVAHLDCLIHFRFATHGSLSADNCHPFPVGRDSAMIHNGILAAYTPPPDDDRSDTRIFVNNLLNPLLTDVTSTYRALRSVQQDLEAHVRGNKLAFLTPDGFVIVNESWGEWQDGVWYSAGYPLSSWEYLWDGPSAWEKDADEDGDKWTDAEERAWRAWFSGDEGYRSISPLLRHWSYPDY